jgi:hypothetical protein
MERAPASHLHPYQPAEKRESVVQRWLSVPDAICIIHSRRVPAADPSTRTEDEMRKLKLSLDELQVDSFHADPMGTARGTVMGRYFTEYADESCFESCNGTCGGGCGSYPASCNGTCYASCSGTCNATCTCPPNTDYTACGCETWETCPGATVCA